MVSHIASLWRYRIPKGRPLQAELDELFDILQDFHHGLGEEEEFSGNQPKLAEIHDAAPAAEMRGVG
jgi:hypothetical protein